MSRPPRVVVAHEDQAIREAAVDAARAAGYEVIGVGDGDSALALLRSSPAPAAIVADVGLPGVAAYELCDEIAAERLAVKVVLIASVYSKTAYKRAPSSLYGADDYVEQHHIVDKLGPKLAALVPAPVPPPMVDVHRPELLNPQQRRDAERIRATADRRLGESGVDAPRTDAEWAARARELARIIIADLVLYNGTEVETWVASGPTPRSLADRPLPPRLLRDLDEARRLLGLGVPRRVVEQRDFAGEALLEFLEGRGGGAVDG